MRRGAERQTIEETRSPAPSVNHLTLIGRIVESRENRDGGKGTYEISCRCVRYAVGVRFQPS